MNMTSPGWISPVWFSAGATVLGSISTAQAVPASSTWPHGPLAGRCDQTSLQVSGASSSSSRARASVPSSLKTRKRAMSLLQSRDPDRLLALGFEPRAHRREGAPVADQLGEPVTDDLVDLPGRAAEIEAV